MNIEEIKKQVEELETKAKTLRKEILRAESASCDHDWGYWEPMPYTDDQYRDCRKCGKTEWR